MYDYQTERPNLLEPENQRELLALYKRAVAQFACTPLINPHEVAEQARTEFITKHPEVNDA